MRMIIAFFICYLITTICYLSTIIIIHITMITIVTFFHFIIYIVAVFIDLTTFLLKSIESIIYQKYLIVQKIFNEKSIYNLQDKTFKLDQTKKREGFLPLKRDYGTLNLIL